MFVQRGTILDVGTATGFFLETATAAGFDAYGIERSEYAARIAASKFGVERIHIEIGGFFLMFESTAPDIRERLAYATVPEPLRESIRKRKLWLKIGINSNRNCRL
jgi:hypothetical protein